MNQGVSKYCLTVESVNIIHAFNLPFHYSWINLLVYIKSCQYNREWLFFNVDDMLHIIAKNRNFPVSSE